MTSNETYILGVESSCDETAAALVTREGRVRVSAVASQIDLHAMFGGVVPEVAARKHIEACLPLIEEAMEEAGAGWDRIEAIAVTSCPGLIGCLLVGVETAKTLAWAHEKPLIAVNHLAGHLHAPQLMPNGVRHLLAEGGELIETVPLQPEDPSDTTRVARAPFPHLGLIVSGGHTSLVEVRAPGQYETVAQTLDDAAGEAYDKAARLMGLGYPGGPMVDKLAAEGDPNAFGFTAPMMRRDKPDFSFSGLKTAVLLEVQRQREKYGETLPGDVLKNLCASFQRAAIDSLLGKSLDALKRRRLNDLCVTGGVACNRGLRRRAAALSAKHKWLRAWFPHPSMCTDNAAMIAGLAWRLKPLSSDEALSLNARSSMPL